MKNEKIGEGTLMNFTNDSVDPYDHHVVKCGGNEFTKMKREAFHSLYKDGNDEDGEDEDEFVG